MDRDSLITFITATIASGDAQTSPLGYDVEAIADELLDQMHGGDLSTVDTTAIWAAVNRHHRPS
ncbi:hypothetical protein [Brachybacterium sp. UNK5269]|uniref:hypothetical protein n=1 Tax=Brachybacterium sp. UNK5269 TaxID=3408576 RepID=UPI003BB1D973